jgi:hypothetical protein
MAGWQQLLRESHPEPLTADQAAAIRRATIAAALNRVPPARHAPVMIIGGILLTAATSGILVTRSHSSAALPSPIVTSPGIRQLQFATPGGTRIIWQFDPEFSLRETLP